ncbi:MAG: ABC transporter substrate-binding protein [Clostridiaceae bacterium]|jgi:branched-chain amino acid transport system substrate-binding protein|nr:ABC transporter substrate-binding protein [Clostridiales bacterium]MDD3540862.1 ABC transporter substrate-binding protein [Eubacteriales bacterium]MDD4186637.1 ABC transporter substrate-binding protein [Eubacteriales bacterium]MDY0119963.1 ABC transporter substrate-binding protein [Clostridia bacterium]NLG30772.1 ABC transporter substrate-binding protein [Clostridiaceae bacterium]
MKKLIAIFLVAFIVLGFTVGCNGGGGKGDVIKIGVFEPFTGANASGGELTYEGIEIALEQVPEVLGRKIEVIKVDNKSETAEAANAAQRLVDRDKVNVIIGSYGSSLSMAAGEIVKKAKVPAVGCSPTNPAVTLDNDYYFRVCFIDPFQGTVMANFATKELGAKTAAVIKDVQQDYSVGLVKFFVDSFKATNGEDSILVEASYKSGDQDFSSQLNNIKQANPDVIFAPGNYGESALLIKQARALDMDQPILGGDTWESGDFIDIGGAAVEDDVYFSSHFSSAEPINAESDKFLKLYKEKYGKEANAFAALGYDAYMVAVDAIKRADSADPVAIRDALAKTSGFIGATGTITLDENGDAVKSAVVNTIENGAFKFLVKVDP